LEALEKKGAASVVIIPPPPRSKNLPWKNILVKPSLNMGRFLVLVASAMYGTNFAAVKMLDRVMPVAASASLRFSLAAVVVTVMVLVQESRSRNVWEEGRTRWSATLFGFEVGVWYFLGYICQALGLQHGEATKSAFFNALAVVVVPLLDGFFRGRRLGTRRIMSVVFALLGVALIQAGPDSDSVSSSARDNAYLSSTDMFCFGQSIFFGVGYWRLEIGSITFPNQSGRITAGLLLAVAFGTLVYWLATSSVQAFLGTSSGIGMESIKSLLVQLYFWLTDSFIVQGLLWTGLVSTALALYLETVALKVVSATELTILMTSVSLWGSAFAYVTMGETISPIGMAGGLMIMLACGLSAPSLGMDQHVE